MRTRPFRLLILLLVLSFSCAQLSWAAPADGEAGVGEVQVTVLERGIGEGAQEGDRLYVDYTLKLYGGDGAVLDTTEGGSPLVFVLGDTNFIEGFTVGLLGAKFGEVRRLVIPPEFGYGPNSAGAIPPNSTLDMEVRVVRILTPGSDMGGDPAELFGRDGRGGRRHANASDLAAVQEFMIRDFFTRPWRYQDAAQWIGRQSLIPTVAFVLLLGWTWFRRRPGGPA